MIKNNIMGRKRGQISREQRLIYLQQRKEQEKTIQRSLNKSLSGKRFDEMLELAANGKISLHWNHKYSAIQHALDRFGTKHQRSNRRYFIDLLILLERKTKMLERADIVIGIENIARNRTYMIRPVSTWRPKSKNVYKQFESLVLHCFEKYSMPKFFYSAFFEKENRNQARWFIHMANGGKLKDCFKFPLTLTKRFSHLFMNSPDCYNVNEAIRYAQVLSIYKDSLLAHSIAKSRLALNFEYNDFWEKFIHLVANGGMFDHSKIDEMVDYLNAELEENPNYSLKGRTLASVMRRSDDWHAAFMGYHSNSNTKWHGCGLSGGKMD